MRSIPHLGGHTYNYSGPGFENRTTLKTKFHQCDMCAPHPPTKVRKKKQTYIETLLPWCMAVTEL
jgi:hypothetical protein